MTGEGKNAVIRWQGVTGMLLVAVCFCNCSGYKLGARNLARGCIQKPQINASSRGICVKLPVREGKVKTIWPLWCDCSSPFLVIARLLAEPLDRQTTNATSARLGLVFTRYVFDDIFITRFFLKSKKTDFSIGLCPLA